MWRGEAGCPDSLGGTQAGLLRDVGRQGLWQDSPGVGDMGLELLPVKLLSFRTAGKQLHAPHGMFH